MDDIAESANEWKEQFDISHPNHHKGDPTPVPYGDNKQIPEAMKAEILVKVDPPETPEIQQVMKIRESVGNMKKKLTNVAISVKEICALREKTEKEEISNEIFEKKVVKLEKIRDEILAEVENYSISVSEECKNIDTIVQKTPMLDPEYDYDTSNETDVEKLKTLRITLSKSVFPIIHEAEQTKNIIFNKCRSISLLSLDSYKAYIHEHSAHLRVLSRCMSDLLDLIKGLKNALRSLNPRQKHLIHSNDTVVRRDAEYTGVDGKQWRFKFNPSFNPSDIRTTTLLACGKERFDVPETPDVGQLLEMREKIINAKKLLVSMSNPVKEICLLGSPTTPNSEFSTIYGVKKSDEITLNQATKPLSIQDLDKKLQENIEKKERIFENAEKLFEALIDDKKVLDKILENITDFPEGYTVNEGRETFPQYEDKLQYLRNIRNETPDKIQCIMNDCKISLCEIKLITNRPNHFENKQQYGQFLFDLNTQTRVLHKCQIDILTTVKNIRNAQRTLLYEDNRKNNPKITNLSNNAQQEHKNQQKIFTKTPTDALTNKSESVPETLAIKVVTTVREIMSKLKKEIITILPPIKEVCKLWHKGKVMDSGDLQESWTAWFKTCMDERSTTLLYCNGMIKHATKQLEIYKQYSIDEKPSIDINTCVEIDMLGSVIEKEITKLSEILENIQFMCEEFDLNQPKTIQEIKKNNANLNTPDYILENKNLDQRKLDEYYTEFVNNMKEHVRKISFGQEILLDIIKTEKKPIKDDDLSYEILRENEKSWKLATGYQNLSSDFQTFLTHNVDTKIQNDSPTKNTNNLLVEESFEPTDTPIVKQIKKIRNSVVKAKRELILLAPPMRELCRLQSQIDRGEHMKLNAYFEELLDTPITTTAENTSIYEPEVIEDKEERIRKCCSRRNELLLLCRHELDKGEQELELLKSLNRNDTSLSEDQVEKLVSYISTEIQETINAFKHFESMTIKETNAFTPFFTKLTDQAKQHFRTQNTLSEIIKGL